MINKISKLQFEPIFTNLGAHFCLKDTYTQKQLNNIIFTNLNLSSLSLGWREGFSLSPAFNFSFDIGGFQPRFQMPKSADYQETLGINSFQIHNALIILVYPESFIYNPCRLQLILLVILLVILGINSQSILLKQQFQTGLRSYDQNYNSLYIAHLRGYFTTQTQSSARTSGIVDGTLTLLYCKL